MYDSETEGRIIFFKSEHHFFWNSNVVEHVGRVPTTIPEVLSGFRFRYGIIFLLHVYGRIDYKKKKKILERRRFHKYLDISQVGYRSPAVTQDTDRYNNDTHTRLYGHVVYTDVTHRVIGFRGRQKKSIKNTPHTTGRASPRSVHTRLLNERHKYYNVDNSVIYIIMDSSCSTRFPYNRNRRE